jgi:hypothetical protein
MSMEHAIEIVAPTDTENSNIALSFVSTLKLTIKIR